MQASISRQRLSPRRPHGRSRRPQTPALVPAAPQSLHTYRKPARSRRKPLSEPASGAERSPDWSSYWWATRIRPLTKGVLPFPPPALLLWRLGTCETRSELLGFPRGFLYFPERLPPPPPLARWRRTHGGTIHGLCRSKINAGFRQETKDEAFVFLWPELETWLCSYWLSGDLSLMELLSGVKTAGSGVSKRNL